MLFRSTFPGSPFRVAWGWDVTEGEKRSLVRAYIKPAPMQAMAGWITYRLRSALLMESLYKEPTHKS